MKRLLASLLASILTLSVVSTCVVFAESNVTALGNFDVIDFGYYSDGGTPVTTFDSNIHVKATVTKQRGDESEERLTLITALYNNSVYARSDIQEKRFIYHGTSHKFDLEIDTSDFEDKSKLTMRTFVWNGIDSMIPLSTPSNFNSDNANVLAVYVNGERYHDFDPSVDTYTLPVSAGDNPTIAAACDDLSTKVTVTKAEDAMVLKVVAPNGTAEKTYTFNLTKPTLSDVAVTFRGSGTAGAGGKGEYVDGESYDSELTMVENVHNANFDTDDSGNQIKTVFGSDMFSVDVIRLNEGTNHFWKTLPAEVIGATQVLINDVYAYRYTPLNFNFKANKTVDVYFYSFSGQAPDNAEKLSEQGQYLGGQSNFSNTIAYEYDPAGTATGVDLYKVRCKVTGEEQSFTVPIHSASFYGPIVFFKFVENEIISDTAPEITNMSLKLEDDGTDWQSIPLSIVEGVHEPTFDIVDGQPVATEFASDLTKLSKMAQNKTFYWNQLPEEMEGINQVWAEDIYENRNKNMVFTFTTNKSVVFYYHRYGENSNSGEESMAQGEGITYYPEIVSGTTYAPDDGKEVNMNLMWKKVFYVPDGKLTTFSLNMTPQYNSTPIIFFDFFENAEDTIFVDSYSAAYEDSSIGTITPVLQSRAIFEPNWDLDEEGNPVATVFGDDMYDTDVHYMCGGYYKFISDIPQEMEGARQIQCNRIYQKGDSAKYTFIITLADDATLYFYTADGNNPYGDRISEDLKFFEWSGSWSAGKTATFDPATIARTAVAIYKMDCVVPKDVARKTFTLELCTSAVTGPQLYIK